MRACGLLAALPLLVACGPSFDRPSALKSLRVLAVQKDKPYALPGDTVNLTLLWDDASPSAPRPIERAWFAGCFNPPGDLYYGCYQALQSAGGAGSSVGSGDHFSFQIPDDILVGRGSSAPNQPVYGLATVFFAVCAGQLSPVLPTSTAEFPFQCLDDSGAPLGSDDFVAGYSSVYVFGSFTNKNPVMLSTPPFDTGLFNFRGSDFPADCMDEGCLDASGGPIPEPDIDCSAGDLRCVPSCADDGGSKCPAHAFRPGVDPTSVEPDSVSEQVFGRNYQEQMWIDYYVDHGGVHSDVRLLNDATNGWNDDYGTDFYAPREPGPVRIWAVVHDNRGGVAWSALTIRVQ